MRTDVVDEWRNLPDARSAMQRAFGELGRARLAYAPGRVNLIGEHIDYCDLAVLPMAIQHGVGVLFRPRTDARVRLHNVDARFAPRTFELGPEAPPFAAGDWGNYVAAAGAILARERGARAGFDAVVTGDLPAAAGLSSSAALVVSSALAFAAANELALAPLELAELCARGERYVGTEGGGMDQAAALLGRAGSALRISFRPLAAQALSIPADWRFIVADSLVVADKSGTVREQYNDRRHSCERALAGLRADPRMGAAEDDWRELTARFPPGDLLAIAEAVLAPADFPRARHVIGEAGRVEVACAALLTGDRAAFGTRMNESHASLRDDFAVSAPELDELAALQRAAGADGARLTGAGFGGSTVALVHAARVPAVLAALEDRFYRPRGIAPRAWVARASEGARIVET